MTVWSARKRQNMIDTEDLLESESSFRQSNLQKFSGLSLFDMSIFSNV